MHARSSIRLLAVAAGAMWALSAQALSVDVDLTGFHSGGLVGSPNNSQTFLALVPGARITGWDFLDLTFSTSGDSFLNEFVISVNSLDGTRFMDAAPSDTASGGSFGPASGSWGSAAGGSVGAPFGVADGKLWVTVYELFVDAGVNATVTGGTLRINFVPEPATYGLMALALIGAVGATRGRTGRRAS